MENFNTIRASKRLPQWWKSTAMVLLTAMLTLGITLHVNAQKFEITGNDAKADQLTEIGLSGSTYGKYYYLLRIDETGHFHSVTFQVGQGDPIAFAPQKLAGKYVIYEFDDFKEFPFNFDIYKPEDGILQTGAVTISSKK